MKKITTLIVATMITIIAFAQSRATSVSYNKAKRPALTLQVPYTEEITEGTIVSKLSEIGYAPKTKGSLFWKKNIIDGYYVFKDVALRNLKGETVDLYFKVTPKSKTEKDKSIITMLVGKGENTFYSSESAPEAFESAQQFLDGFTTHSASFKLSVDITSQEASVKAAETKYAKLQEEEITLTKKIEELQLQLQNNKTNQETQKQVIDAAKLKLEELKTKS